MTSSRRGTAAPLGQHLLTNPRVAHTVAKASGAKKGVTVLEIGPGKGALTKELLALGAEVIAVEKDPMMVAALEETFIKEIADRTLRVIEGDARSHEPDHVIPHGAYVVAANIPYYITGELIRTFLTARNQPKTVSLLVQKEVAERIARSKKESILSLSVKVFGNPRYVETVKRGNFNPPPKVDSAVLVITNVSRKNFKKISESRFFKVVKAGFAQKRKTLSGNLKRAFGRDVEQILEHSGIAPMARAEDVSLEQWLKLASKL